MSPPRTWSPETKIGVPIAALGGLMLTVLWLILDVRERVSKLEGYMQAKSETAAQTAGGTVANK